MTTTPTTTYKLRVGRTLLSLLNEAARRVSSYGIDENEIVRRTARMVNRLTISAIEEKMGGFVPDESGDRLSIVLQVRGCQKPNCSSTQFRKVLEWRCREALKVSSVETFKTPLREGHDFIIVSTNP